MKTTTAVIRLENAECRGERFASREEAMWYAPSDPESRIISHDGRVLAYADEDRAAWVLTPAGLAYTGNVDGGELMIAGES